MSTIDVTRAVPQRLFFSDDGWCLEVQRWQSLDRDLFNPIRSFIVGTNRVSAYLKENTRSRELLAQARDILASQGAVGASYSFNGRDWLLDTEFVDRPPAGSGDVEAVQRSVNQLEDRLGQLEQRLAAHLPGNDPHPSVRPLSNEEAAPHSSTG